MVGDPVFMVLMIRLASTSRTALCGGAGRRQFEAITKSVRIVACNGSAAGTEAPLCAMPRGNIRHGFLRPLSGRSAVAQAFDAT